MKILNLGSCNIDSVYSLDHIVEVGETENANTLELFPGGKGLNQSIAVARAGAPVYHAGCIGHDGKMLIETLKDAGVDVSYIKETDVKSGHAIIQVSAKGENSIVIFAGSNNMVTKDYIDTVLTDFGKGDMLMLQNEISNIDYAVEKAHEKNMIILFNPSPINEKICTIDFNKLSYIILNEVEAKSFSGCDNPHESLAYFKSNYPGLKVMLTLGTDGSIFSNGKTELYQSAFSVTAVDTTAAGDTFTGYFAAGIYNGDSFADILRTASAASAIAVSKMGAAPSIPKRDEVEAKIRVLKEIGDCGKKDYLIKSINSYITGNIKNADLDGLAAFLGYSVVYTGRLTKELTGKSFSKLLQSKRCSIAAELLMNTNMPVSEIIRSIGYENENFFRKIFVDKYGKTPLAFRKHRN